MSPRVISPSICGLYELYGSDINDFPVYAYSTYISNKGEFGNIINAIINEFSRAELTITVKHNNVIQGQPAKSLYYIPPCKQANKCFEHETTCVGPENIDPLIIEMTKNDKLYVFRTDEFTNTWTITLKIGDLLTDVIPFIGKGDPNTNIIPLKNVPEKFAPNNFYFGPYTTERIITKKIKNKMSRTEPTGIIMFEKLNITPDIEITYTFNVNYILTPYECQLETIETMDVHLLHPAVKDGKRARLCDGQCKAFGCAFTGSEEEVKEHLQSIKNNNYIDNYAASHSKIAFKTKGSPIKYANNAKRDANIKTLGYMTKICSIPEPIYKLACASALCQFTCDNEHQLYEHYRLIGAHGPEISKYYQQNSLLLRETTELDNRNHLKSIIANKKPKPTILNYSIIKNHQSHVDDFINAFNDPESVCKICFVAKPNVIPTSCKHVEICSECINLYKDKRCLACLNYIEYCIVIPKELMK